MLSPLSPSPALHSAYLATMTTISGAVLGDFEDYTLLQCSLMCFVIRCYMQNGAIDLINIAFTLAWLNTAVCHEPYSAVCDTIGLPLVADWVHVHRVHLVYLSLIHI